MSKRAVTKLPAADATPKGWSRTGGFCDPLGVQGADTLSMEHFFVPRSNQQASCLYLRKLSCLCPRKHESNRASVSVCSDYFVDHLPRG